MFLVELFVTIKEPIVPATDRATEELLTFCKKHKIPVEFVY